MRHPGKAAGGRAAPIVVGLLMGLAGLTLAQSTLVVEVEFTVTDARGRPVTDLGPDEVETIHGAEKQKITTFEVLSEPGRYELTYAPLSGQSAPVYLRSLRQGTRIAGPDGGPLKPRLVVPPSADEVARDRQLAEALEDQPDDFDFRVAILRFEASPTGVHHTVVVQVHLATLPPDPSMTVPDGRLEILAHLLDEDGTVVHRMKADQALELSPTGSQDFVWTGDVHLAPGRYRLHVLVREISHGRSAVQTLPIEAREAGPGLRMSSVVLLQPREVVFSRAGGDDDPLYVGEEPVMPNANVILPLDADAPVRFFVVLYPDAKSTEAPELNLVLLRGDTRIGALPLELPEPEPSGEIRYVGLLGTSTFRAATYTLRLVASQGPISVSEETPFQMKAWRDMRIHRVTSLSASSADREGGASRRPPHHRPEGPPAAHPTRVVGRLFSGLTR